MTRQYIVKCKDIDEKIKFYDFLINNGFEPIYKYDKNGDINNNFPFVIEADNTFWVCKSITCCAAAVTCGIMISVEQFYDILKDQKKLILK